MVAESELHNASKQAQELLQTVRHVKRSRELYKYFDPENLVPPRFKRRDSTFTQYAPNVTNLLSPFAQLAAIRCGAQKAMINVMDRDIMYFLAEATTLKSEVENGNMFALIEDPIFVGCAAVSLEGRICEMTIREEAVAVDHAYPIFQVRDLSKDTRFANMPIVAGEPHYRYYAGTPIRTQEGINIGSLAIMDTKARNGLTDEEEHCLGELADHIMNLLQINRQAIAGRRSRRLAEGLDTFVGGRHTLEEDAPVDNERPTVSPVQANHYGVLSDPSFPLSNGAGSGQRNSQESVASAISAHNTSDESESSLRNRSRRERLVQSDLEGDPVSKTFSRAANLIRESLDLPEDAGCVFFNVNHKLAADPNPNSQSSENALPGILASSTAGAPLAEGGIPEEYRSIANIDQDFLRDLLSRHPSGRSWAFGDNGTKLSSSSDEEALLNNEQGRVPRKSRSRPHDTDALLRAFSGARSILFYPLYDVILSHRNIACFVFSSSETRPLGSSALTFINSFCNTAKAECDRIDAVKGEIQKERFVSTISHEMRSPLHGVLASVEFLEESQLDSFQRSLVESISACGRTLLDTIDMILSYSKVASFEKSWQASQGLKRRRQHLVSQPPINRSLSAAAPQMLQLYAATDISVVLEEVLDGVSMGRTYSRDAGLDDEPFQNGARPATIDVGQSLHPSDTKDSVEVIVNVQKEDWVFLTAPGSIRRIFMNLYGNSCKYTRKGFIKVQLELRELEESPPEQREGMKVMVFTVIDTGRGMSEHYQASKLFTPFAQENSLSPGTGLGMSIVRSIVNMLGGTIEVKSQLGVGTTVKIALPVSRPLEGSQSSKRSPHSGASSKADSVIELQQKAPVCRVAFFHSANNEMNPGLVETLSKYVSNWFGFLIVDFKGRDADFLILDEADFDSVKEQACNSSGRMPALIVLCDTSSQRRQIYLERQRSIDSNVAVVTKPCGPHKLAKALLTCMEGIQNPDVSLATMIAHQTRPPQVDNIADSLQELRLENPRQKSVTVVQASETFAASQVSRNAQMAINTPNLINGPQAAYKDLDTFPFPTQEEDSATSDSAHRRHSSSNSTGTAYLPPPELTQSDSIPTPRPAAEAKSDTRVLLVDDNKINLKLLQTFIKKRKYEHVESAEDGQQAVDAVQRAVEPYDVIFMDISMPVMNGFEATKAIRTHEAKGKEVSGAMIIALTGLASAKDQSDAFVAGCDLYMTKPVKFKEVGRLLDNWEAHRSLNVSGDAPQVGGALTEFGQANGIVT